MRYVKLLYLGLLAFGLVSCASKSNNESSSNQGYRNMPPLVVPRNVSDMKISSHYPIPDVPNNAKAAKMTPEQLAMPPK